VHYLNKCKKRTDTKDSLPRVACLRYGAGPETFAKFSISGNIVLCMYDFLSTFKRIYLRLRDRNSCSFQNMLATDPEVMRKVCVRILGWLSKSH